VGYSVDDRATGSLILKICIVLIDHLVEKVVVDQISFAIWILLVRCNRCSNVVPLEANWRRVMVFIVVQLARETRPERRLLCCLLVGSFVILLDRLVRIVLVRLKGLERFLSAALPRQTPLQVVAIFLFLP